MNQAGSVSTAGLMTRDEIVNKIVEQKKQIEALTKQRDAAEAAVNLLMQTLAGQSGREFAYEYGCRECRAEVDSKDDLCDDCQQIRS